MCAVVFECVFRRCVGVGESKLLTGVGQEGVSTPCVGTCRRVGLVRTVRPAP